MKTEIMMKTYELVDEIKDSKSYQELLLLKEKLNQDEHVISLVEQYKKSYDKYVEVKKYGKYHPDLKKVQNEYSKNKELLYTHPLVMSYKKYEKEIEKMLNDISREIANAVSKKIKYKNEIGLMKK